MNWFKSGITIFSMTCLMISSPTFSVANISQLEKSISLTRQQQADLEQNLKTTEIAQGQLNQQIILLNAQSTTKQRSLSLLEKNQRLAAKKLAIQRTALAQQLKAMYQGELSPALKLLLNQQNPECMQRQLAYYRYLNQTRLRLLQDIEGTLNDINQTSQTITTQQQSIQNILLQKQHQQTLLRDTQAKRKKWLSRINQDLQTKQQQLTKLLEDQRNLQSMVSTLQTQSLTLSNQPFNRLRGKLRWPVQGTLQSAFGSPLNLGSQRLTGVVFQVAPGTPVRAIYAGQVIFANWLRGFGLLIIINHGNGYMSLYARNSALFAKTGQTVGAGDEIAATGDSGGYQKPSLYFEIRQNGSPVNPASWCS